MLLPQEIIRLKRDGKVLTQAQIAQFVDGLVNNSFNDAQAGAMAMAIFQQGMNTDEITALTLAMMNSGQVLRWPDIDGAVVDKHSTGGVGDKVSFMLAAIVAACGAYVPMISGRGLGHTGGTADKLESIKGFNVTPSIEAFKKIVKRDRLAIISQTTDLAPADKRLYGIRDVTACVESIPLITASILSKKLAAGLDGLVMDVKVGNGAMMNNLDDAIALAKSINRVSNQAGVVTQTVITDMNQVLGRSAGNAIEMFETVQYLTGEYRDPRLHAVVIKLAELMLINSQIATSEIDANQRINAVLANGQAAEQFEKMIAALGGPNDYLSQPWAYMPKAKIVKDIKVGQSGYINHMQTRDIGLSVVELGGGRISNTDNVDHSVGFDHVMPVGTKVSKGDVVAQIHATDEASANKAMAQYLSALSIGEHKADENPVIYQVINE
ncbi:thymidine phosphorylase [Thalassotalea sp. LPB0316]|uniref:thymidine phosphorylase n=1 Tax=Thalassotalea sp. LPB0316 TaxID=2769490 RepID=UPI001866AB6F|nr:thymidine phosphorylase [Thalassotalea sp. LPB0316]QOL24928.1 thymidine phosphorylase [Thalassotalea sp. LPB0316]